MRGVPDGLARRQAAAVDPRAGYPASPAASNPSFSGPDGQASQDTPQIVRLASPRVALAPYMCFDEAYFKTLESMQWNRDNGCVELIPIVVGMP